MNFSDELDCSSRGDDSEKEATDKGGTKFSYDSMSTSSESSNTPSEQKQFHCRLCSFSSSSDKIFSVHSVNAHGVVQSAAVSRLRCKRCPFFTDSMIILKSHSLNNHGILVEEKSMTKKIFTCARCPYKTNNWKILKSHCNNMHRLHLPTNSPRYN